LCATNIISKLRLMKYKVLGLIITKQANLRISRGLFFKKNIPFFIAQFTKVPLKALLNKHEIDFIILKLIILNCDFFTKVNCAFPWQENIK